MTSDWDEESYADSDWDDSDGWDDEPVDLIDCPHCGAEVYEEAEQCPRCGEYITRVSTSAWDGKPAWWVVLGLLGIVAVILTLTQL